MQRTAKPPSRPLSQNRVVRSRPHTSQEVDFSPRYSPIPPEISRPHTVIGV